jgi:hypothetical protein
MTPETFHALIDRHPYLPKGVFYSELFLFLWLCGRVRASHVIESGVKFGMSSRVLASVYRGHVFSIDKAPGVQFPPGVIGLVGDAFVRIPQLLADFSPRDRIGVLIDGPKGAEALRLREIVWRHPAVHVVAVHDQAPGVGETVHSHDDSFRGWIGDELDARIDSPYARKYPDGPGLAVWVRA